MGSNRGSNNVKVNEFSKRKTNNVNVKNAFDGAMDRYAKMVKPRPSGSSQARIRRARAIADDLSRKFGSSSKGSYRFFCKCAYNLPESTIYAAYESSCHWNIQNKLAYFLAAMKAQPEMQH